MKRFRFSLERLLKLKQQQERLAELRQQAARAALDAALAEVVRAEERVAEAAGGGEEALRRAVAAGLWQARYEQVAALGQGLEAAQAQARDAEQKVQEAAKARARVAAEVETLQLLRRQQWQAHQDDMARRGQAHLDEVGLRRWRAARDAKRGEG